MLGLRPPSSWQDLALERCPPGGLPRMVLPGVGREQVLLPPAPDLAPAVGVGGLSWRWGPQREGLRELPRVRQPSCLGWPVGGAPRLGAVAHG